ncbi:MAG: hypothetical protein ABIH38_01405 [Patescibacteria group bacterium]
MFSIKNLIWLMALVFLALSLGWGIAGFVYRKRTPVLKAYNASANAVGLLIISLFLMWIAHKFFP